MKVLLCTPYLESPDVVSSGIGTWARNIMAYNQETGNRIDIVPVSFDRHTHIEEYTVGGFKRYYSGIKKVGKCVLNAIRKIKTEKPDGFYNYQGTPDELIDELLKAAHAPHLMLHCLYTENSSRKAVPTALWRLPNRFISLSSNSTAPPRRPFSKSTTGAMPVHTRPAFAPSCLLALRSAARREP